MVWWLTLFTDDLGYLLLFMFCALGFRLILAFGTCLLGLCCLIVSLASFCTWLFVSVSLSGWVCLFGFGFGFFVLLIWANPFWNCGFVTLVWWIFRYLFV